MAPQFSPDILIKFSPSTFTTVNTWRGSLFRPMGTVLINFPLSFRSGPIYVSQPLRFLPLKSNSHPSLCPDFAKATISKNTGINNNLVDFISENYFKIPYAFDFNCRGILFATALAPLLQWAIMIIWERTGCNL